MRLCIIGGYAFGMLLCAQMQETYIHDLSVPVEMNISVSAFKMYLIYLPMCGWATRVQVPSRPAEGAGVPGVGVTGGSESLK